MTWEIQTELFTMKALLTFMLLLAPLGAPLCAIKISGSS